MTELVHLDDLDVLMQKVRANIEARKSRIDTQDFVSAGKNNVPPPVDVKRTHYSAAELLASYDSVFMRTVYLAITGHEPCGKEAAQLLQELRLGKISRIDVIDILLTGHDARERGVVITGLRRQRFYDRMRRSIVLGKMTALARIARNIPRLASYMRQVISRVDGAERKVNQLELQLIQANQERQALEVFMQQQVQVLSARINTLHEQFQSPEFEKDALSICINKAPNPVRANYEA